jgi:hypothetical protein
VGLAAGGVSEDVIGVNLRPGKVAMRHLNSALIQLLIVAMAVPAIAQPLGESALTPPAVTALQSCTPGHYYPDRALRSNMAGKTTIQCKIAAEGALQDCVVVDENPQGYGFGQGALCVAETMRVHAKDGALLPVGATFRRTIVWRPPPSPQPPGPSGLTHPPG